jgi:hypothetical protein
MENEKPKNSSAKGNEQSIVVNINKRANEVYKAYNRLGDVSPLCMLHNAGAYRVFIGSSITKRLAGKLRNEKYL